MTQAFQINDRTIKPGQQATVNIPVARLHTHTEMTMPVHVVRGKKEGPVLFVSAAIHGDEILGVEIIRRLINSKRLGRMRGVLIAVPVVNVFGFIDHSRYLPDRRDLNHFFPGSETGSLASRLANIFMQEVVERSTHGIDLHTGSNHRGNLPQIRARLDEPHTRELAEAFGAPVIIDANVRDGSLRQAVMEKGIPMLLYEAGEALRFDELAIRTGIKGILSLMRHIGMLPAASAARTKKRPLVASSTIWVRAAKSGILRSAAALGSIMSKNELLGIIADPFGGNEEKVHAPVSGIVIGNSNLPLVHEGDAIFHIAHFDEKEIDQSVMQEFQAVFNGRADSVS
jgi:predicted deacylase